MALTIIILISIAALAFAGYLARWVLENDTGTARMQDIAGAIKEGAEAFLARQNASIARIGGAVAVLLFLLYWLVRPTNPHDPAGPFGLALATAFSFAFGALCSGVAGYVGMFVSIRANLRTASAARTSLNTALQIALRGGAVSGLFVVSMSLLGVSGLFILFRGRFEFGNRVIGNPIASLVGLVLTAQFPIALVLWLILWFSEPAPTVVIPTRAGEPAATSAVPPAQALADQFWWVDPFIACGAVIIVAALTGIALRNENASDEMFETLAQTPSEPDPDAAQ